MQRRQVTFVPPWFFAFLFATMVFLAPSLARAVVYPCTDAGLTSALAAGGVATFSCTAPTTVVVSATRTVSASGTNLDGGGRLIISGGGARVPLSVAAGVTAQIRNVVLEAGNTGGYGGCLAVSGNLTMADSTIRNCSASIGGSGAWVNGGGQLRLDRCTLSGNSGGVEGTIATHGALTIANSTISDNSFRGIVARYGGSAIIDNSTIVTSPGESLFAVAAGDTVSVSHSILFAPTGVASVSGSGSFISRGYNMLSNSGGTAPTGDTTTNQLNVTPLLGSLANNGGPTLTRALLPCSPGINAGASSGGPATDQRGAARLVNGAMDIGAFESTQNTCVSIDSVSRNEGNTGLTPLAFTVKLSGATTLNTRVNWATADGTATVADGDYSAASGTLTFAPGARTAPVTLQVTGDTRFEPNETVAIDLSSPSSLSLGTARGIATIINDDPVPSLSVADMRLAEGNSGARAMTFTVSLSNATSQTVTVNYATANGTATVADGDYTAASGVLTFAAGVRSRTVTVNITGDTRFEPDETLTFTLSGAVNATIADGTATGTIANDDGVPSFSIADVSVMEGMTGTTSAVFTVTLSNPSAVTATVNYATANATATAGSDYTAASGILTFAPGVTSRTVTVAVTGDPIHEDDETFLVVLSAPVGATLGDDRGTGTIVNDDAIPALTVGDARVSEGNTATAPLVFDVTLSNPSDEAVTVSYATADGTATLDDNDYVTASGVLTFAPGATRQTVRVDVRGDARFEPDETLKIALNAPSGATIADGSGAGTVVNDDAVAALSIGDVTVIEGNGGSTDAVFTVTLNGPSGVPVTVRYATKDGTATAGSDYTARSGTLTFAPGIVSQTVTVPVMGDALAEANETFSVELSAPTSATIADGAGTGTITDDEGQPGLAVGGASVAEGNTGSRVVTVTVTLSRASAQPVTVDWATADGTATVADGDYRTATGTLTFEPSATSKTVQIEILGDLRVETDETLLVRLSNAIGSDIATGEGTVTITNDDTEAPASDGGIDDDASAPEPAPSFDAGVDSGVPAAPTEADGGCGCAVAGSDALSKLWWIAGTLLMFVVAASRRRRTGGR